MNPLQIRAYLARIGVPLADDAPLPAPTLAWLERVQRAQALSVPFENCDQHSDAKLLTGEQLYAWGLNETGTASEFAQPIFDKIVVRNRGGVCFEQNVLFCALLRALGFSATFLKGHVNIAPRGAPTIFQLAAHIGIRVEIDGAVFYVDVGFGLSPLVPLPFDKDGECAEFSDEQRKVLRRTWRVDTVSAADHNIPGDETQVSLLSAREPNLTDFYARIIVCRRPWTLAEITAAVEHVYRDPQSWFRNTIIAIRNSATHQFVLLTGELTETEIATGESKKRAVSFDELAALFRDDYQFDLPQGFHLPLPTNVGA